MQDDVSIGLMEVMTVIVVFATVMVVVVMMMMTSMFTRLVFQTLELLFSASADSDFAGDDVQRVLKAAIDNSEQLPHNRHNRRSPSGRVPA